MEEEQDLFIPRSKIPAKIIQVKIGIGDRVNVEDQLLIYEFEEPIYNDLSEKDENLGYLHKRQIVGYQKTRDFLISLYSGTIQSINVKPGQEIKTHKKSIITILQDCGHSVQFNEMCALCGKDLSIKSYLEVEQKQNINMMHSATGLTVTKTEAERLEKQNTSRLIESKKLSLIVDLDQTIIHASCDERIGEWINKNSDTSVKDIFSFELGEYQGERYYIKLRPGLLTFLKEISKYYELHIYTMGTRQYADKVAFVIDPKKEYFSERILSRDESGSITKKKLERLFPCDTSMVVVIDDRADVWEWSPNLIKVHPYEFFSGTGDINHSENEQRIGLGNSEDEANGRAAFDLKEMVDKENDQELFKITSILKNIHHDYYIKGENNRARDVKRILPKMKESILDGVRLVFSSIFPTSIDPQLTELWQWAESFGAVCYMEVNKYTTHLVCKPFLTDKVKTAIINGIKIVSLEWIIDSLIFWKRQSEEKYLCTFEGIEIENDKPGRKFDESLDSENTLSKGSGDRDPSNNFDLFEADKEVDDFLAESDNTSTDVDETDDEESIKSKGSLKPKAFSRKLVKKAAANRYLKNSEVDSGFPEKENNNPNGIVEELNLNSQTATVSDTGSDDDSLSDLVREIDEGIESQ